MWMCLACGALCRADTPWAFTAFRSELDAYEGAAFLVHDPAKMGGLVTALDAIAHAGINIDVIQSITLDGALAAILWVDEADEPRLHQVLQTL